MTFSANPLYRLIVAAALVAPATAQASQVEITGAWSRATAPQQNEGVVYLSMTSPAGDMLTGASSPDAAGAMLHKTTEMGGMSGMTDMDAIALPAGKTVSLSPHGMHIMLMGLKHPLVAGDRISLSLDFAKAGRETVSVPVQPIGAEGAPR
jgi:copper(I)-binding protein